MNKSIDKAIIAIFIIQGTILALLITVIGRIWNV